MRKDEVFYWQCAWSATHIHPHTHTHMHTHAHTCTHTDWNLAGIKWPAGLVATGKKKDDTKLGKAQYSEEPEIFALSNLLSVCFIVLSVEDRSLYCYNPSALKTIVLVLSSSHYRTVGVVTDDDFVRPCRRPETNFNWTTNERHVEARNSSYDAFNFVCDQDHLPRFIKSFKVESVSGGTTCSQLKFAPKKWLHNWGLNTKFNK